MEERWKDIVGYEGLYEVSNLGRVRNRHGRIRKTFIHPRGGHVYVNICKEGWATTKPIYVLMTQAFIGEPKKIEHVDGDRTNNRIANFKLTW